MLQNYKCLSQREFVFGKYKLIPIRFEDRHFIREWRNQQIAILRQKEPLTIEKQDLYFEQVVSKLFEQEKPAQLLFSFLESDSLIGYGGLVHIDWESRNAEVSFLTNTQRANDVEQFVGDWIGFLKILKRVASQELDFIKIYTYAYDTRPFLYTALENCSFVQEARLKSHVVVDGKWVDVLIHSCFLDSITFRMATKEDALLYFNWVNDPEVRKNSFHTNAIAFEDHVKWFNEKLNSDKCYFYLFLDVNGVPVGQVRIESYSDETVIGISLDRAFRGRALSSKMIIKATKDYF
ncbi:MAG: N-acetyltransferase, partial [Cytophagia bacterium]|nr:N-acetyltransferase [Cytophagia bacterium]